MIIPDVSLQCYLIFVVAIIIVHHQQRMGMAAVTMEEGK
jgi:hypothetical protein